MEVAAFSHTLLPSGSTTWYCPPRGVAKVLNTTCCADDEASYCSCPSCLLMRVLPCRVMVPFCASFSTICFPSASVRMALLPPGPRSVDGWCVCCTASGDCLGLLLSQIHT